jgi:hypothetical protein
MDIISDTQRMKAKERIKLSDKDIKVLHERLCIEALEKTIEYARHLNFPKKVHEGSLQRIMHGTEFLHVILKKKLITNALYQQLKKVAEDLTLEYEIVTK